jgi:hypothetical protein
MSSFRHHYRLRKNETGAQGLVAGLLRDFLLNFKPATVAVRSKKVEKQGAKNNNCQKMSF